jgi:metallo-beta-lactamase family protein
VGDVTAPRLRFLGAAGTVSGSRFVEQHRGRRVMIDAGLTIS